MTIKYSQNELKRQKDVLRQYERYLPNLQLKKQLLQLEIVSLQSMVREREDLLVVKERESEVWLPLMAEAPEISPWLVPDKVITGKRNIAGVDIPVFSRVEFPRAEYDLFLTPLWVDTALLELQDMVSLQEEIEIIGDGIDLLRNELRITTQRVNLFEKVKIPDAIEAIRQIKIFLGDQMTTAVCRSKIAKNKIKDIRAEEVVI